jgi:hypothetical protein
MHKYKHKHAAEELINRKKASDKQRKIPQLHLEVKRAAQYHQWGSRARPPVRGWRLSSSEAEDISTMI